MRESDKHRFLDAPISQAGLFGEAVEGFAQQFSTAQQQTEAFRHIRCCLHPTAGCSPSICSSPSAPSCGLHLRSSSASAAAFTTAAAWSWPQESGAARLCPCQAREAPRQAAFLRRATRSLWILLFRRRAGWRIFCSLFVLFRHWLSSQFLVPSFGTQNLKKRAVSFFSGSQEGEDGSARDPVSTLPSPSPFACEQQGPVRGRDAFSRAPCSALEPGKCRTAHSDPTSERTAFRVGPLSPLRCPTAGTSVASLVPLVRSLGAWLALPRPSRWLMRTIRLGYTIQFARVLPSSGAFSSPLCWARMPLSCVRKSRVLLAKDAIEPVPPAEMKSGFYSPYFIVPKKGGGLRPILDLCVLNRALHKLPFRMLTQRRIFNASVRSIVRSDRPEGRVHSCLNPPSTQNRFLRFAFEGRAYQYKVLPFGLIPVASCLHQGRGGSPSSIKGSRHSRSQLPRRLAQSRALLCEHRDTVLGHLSRLGLRVNWEKSKLSPVQRISFLGMELDSVNLTARLSVERAQSMLNCLESFQRKRAVPTETLSEAPGAYGIRSRGPHRSDCFIWDRFSIASRPGPEMGMATWHVPGLSYPVLPSDLRPVVGSCFSSGRSSP